MSVMRKKGEGRIMVDYTDVERENAALQQRVEELEELEGKNEKLKVAIQNIYEEPIVISIDAGCTKEELRDYIKILQSEIEAAREILGETISGPPAEVAQKLFKCRIRAKQALSSVVESTKGKSSLAEKRIQLYDGDMLRILPESTDFNFVCCKCGWTHTIEIRREDEFIDLVFTRGRQEVGSEPAKGRFPVTRNIIEGLRKTTGKDIPLDSSARVESAKPKYPNDICMDCGRHCIVWFADNEVWNRVISPENRFLMLCPTCFVVRAEAQGIKTTGWKMTPEDYDSAKPETSHRLKDIERLQANTQKTIDQVFSELLALVTPRAAKPEREKRLEEAVEAVLSMCDGRLLITNEIESILTAALKEVGDKP